mgnify:CR=1 FL=1
MSLIAAGGQQRKLANLGLKAVSEAEAVEERQRLALETAKTAQENQTLGTGAGFGAMYGTNRLIANNKTAKTAIEGVNKLVGNGSQIGSSGGNLTLAESGGSVLKGAEATTTINEMAAAADLATANATATATATAGEVAAGAELTTAVAGGEAVATTQAASLAAGNTGAMATLGTVAAPIAIALGIGFLFNELF